MRIVFVLAAMCVALSSTHASDAEIWYSERGLRNSGVSIANDLVTEFWDIPAGTDFAKVGKRDGKRGAPPRGWDQTIAGKEPGTQKNIVWRVTLPHWGHNAPVVINEKVFLLYEDGWKADAPMLLCLDVHTGKTLWEQAVDHLDSLPGSEQKKAKEARAIEQQRYRDYMKLWNELYYNNERHAWRSKEEREAMFPAFQKKAEAAGFRFKTANTASGFKGVRGRFGIKIGQPQDRGGEPIDKALVTNFQDVKKNRWLLRQNWTTERPWYGNTHGSAVSDGTYIYAVTGSGAAACFDLDGKRRWVQWMNPEWVFYGKGSGYHGNVQSPVLADGKLVYFHRDSATMFAFDKETGKQAFATRVPGDPNGKKDAKYHNFSGHIGPGSTAIVLNLGGTPVAVAGNGMVVRLTDGHMLGLVEGKIHTYLDMTGKNDIYVTTFHEDKLIKLGAVRLGVDGDKLTQKRLWVTAGPGGEGMGNWESAACVSVDGNRVFTKMRGKGAGMTAFDLETGKVLSKGGPTSNYYAAGDKYYITRGGRTTVRHRTATFVDKSTFKTVGKGLLIEPPASGDIADRHIGFLGWPEIWTGYCKLSVWGNRIFIRTNDYLWCIGDPKKSFTAPAPIGK